MLWKYIAWQKCLSHNGTTVRVISATPSINASVSLGNTWK